MKYVVDASVLVKCYVPEPLSDRARGIMLSGVEGEAELYAPDIIFGEVGNVLWKKWRRGEIASEEAKDIADALVQLSYVIVTDSSVLLPGALEIALAYERSVYDSLYLALTLAEEALFVTADERLVNSLKNTTLAQNIIWLGGLVPGT